MGARTIRFTGRQYELIDEVGSKDCGIAVFVSKEKGYCWLLEFDWYFYKSSHRLDLHINDVSLSNNALLKLAEEITGRSETA